MRYILYFWALPMGLFWGWYGLSVHDMNFGSAMLSREVHDLVFGLYGQILGVDPAALPALAARACVVDTLAIFAILAFRRRRAIRQWLAVHGYGIGPRTGIDFGKHDA